MTPTIRRSMLGVLGSIAISLAIGGARAQSFGPQSLAPLVRIVAPQVVGIAVNQVGPQLARKSIAAGSGFIVSSDGMIVTNNHVIANAGSIVVALNDKTLLPAKLIGCDPLTDVAVIKVSSPRPLPVIHWGNSNLVQVGDWVLAAGNPYALGNSFTIGIVSAEGRDIGDGPFDHFLQLDAPINPGNSGGPAFNMNGAVIGINTAIVSPSGGSVGIGFAIPSNAARQIVAEIIAHGGVVRGWLGVSVADVTDASGRPLRGGRISAIEPNGPADRAGLLTNDVVLRVNKLPVASAADFIRAIASLTPGVNVTLQIERRGHIYRLPVLVARRPVQLGG